MTIERDVLEALINHDLFQSDDAKALGIARLAVDTDFDRLSAKQQHVLQPFLTVKCDGVQNPGGYHNNCQNRIEGNELLGAIESYGYYDAMLCVSCQEEQDNYTNEWERINAE